MSRIPVRALNLATSNMAKYSKIPRPVWFEINLDHIAHNIREIKRIVKPGTLIAPAIKANGYGHGAVEIAQTLLDAGANWLSVATLNEALQLRQHYPSTCVFVMGWTPKEDASSVVKNDIIQTVFSFDQAEAFDAEAQKQGKTVRLHVKIDTGMSRLGMLPEDPGTVEEIKRISKLKNIKLEGIFTHFPIADVVDKAFTQNQVEKFKKLVSELEAAGIDIPLKHVSNSAAIIDCSPAFNFDMVRPGIMIYGLYPSPDVSHEAVKLKEAVSLKARLSHVKELEPGVGVSYGLIYTTKKKTMVGTLPMGYADGYTRLYTHKTQGIVCGKKMPLVGRICMDQMMIDVSGTGAKRGDIVTLIGSDGTEKIAVDDLANSLNTINYETVAGMMGLRVPRVYLRNGEIVGIRDYVLELAEAASPF